MKETQRQFNRRIRNRFAELLKTTPGILFCQPMYHCDKRKKGGRRKVFKCYINSPRDLGVWQQIVKENRSQGWLFWQGSEYIYGGKQYGMVNHEKK